jgi:hypothetical protein
MDPLNEEEMLAYARMNSQEAFEAESCTLNYNSEGTGLNREIFRYCQKWAEMVMTYDLTRLSSEYRRRKGIKGIKGGRVSLKPAVGLRIYPLASGAST